MNNTTDSLQESDICLFADKNKLRIIRIVVYTTVALATYFGNILILVTLRKFPKQLKGIPYILLGHLAVADLLLALGLTIRIIEVVLPSLHDNSFFCVVKPCILCVSKAASGILLMFMSIDKFCAIVFPIKHLVRSSKCRRRRIKLTVVWVLTLLFVCIPIVTRSSLKPENGARYSCDMIPKELLLGAAVFIPLQFIINIVMCLFVIRRLKSNAMSKHKYKTSRIKSALLIKIYIVFAICWSPFVVTTILSVTRDDQQKYIAICEYTIIPGLMNSAMNWIIYGLANKKLRHAFKNLLLCRNQRQHRLSNYIQSKSSNQTECKTSAGEVHPCETCEMKA